VIKIIKHLIKSILLTPLNMVMIPLALCTITCKALIRRFQDVEGDLKSIVPGTAHKIKLLRKNKKKNK
jgi:hypothetical protein